MNRNQTSGVQSAQQGKSSMKPLNAAQYKALFGGTSPKFDSNLEYTLECDVKENAPFSDKDSMDVEELKRRTLQDFCAAHGLDAARAPDALRVWRGEAHVAPAQQAQDAGLQAAQETPPLTPSEFWADRANKRGENPAAFIRRVYFEGMALNSQTLSRASLLATDQPLYQAYATWIRPGRHPEDDLGLPTEARVKASTAEEYQERRRAQNREADRRYRTKQIAF